MKPHEIKLARELLRLTQAQLGQVLGVHWITVSRWERGRSPPGEFYKGIYYQLLHRADNVKSRAVGRQVRRLLASQGSTVALYRLLGFAVNGR